MNRRFNPLPKFARKFPWTLWGLLGLGTLSTFLGELKAEDPRPTAEVRPENYIASQIDRLANPSFAVRERATRNLIEAGIAARSALTGLLGNSDAEVRARARQVLGVVLEADFRLRLKAFERDTTGQFHYDLPSWTRFGREVGDSRDARSLFVYMQHAEPNLLETLVENPKEVSALFSERCQAVQSAMYSQMNVQDEGDGTVVTVGTVAALLFVAGAAEVHVDEQDALYLDNIVRFPSFEKELKIGSQAVNCRRLVGRWIARNAAPNAAIQNLTLAFNLELKEGADLARRMLASNDGPVESKPYALLAVGRFGTSDDIPMIEERFFKDNRVCVRNRGGRDVQIQVRDVALAVALHLAQQELNAYGLTNVKTSTQMVFLPNTIWFADNAAREAAFKKWGEWQASKASPAK